MFQPGFPVFKIILVFIPILYNFLDNMINGTLINFYAGVPAIVLQFINNDLNIIGDQPGVYFQIKSGQ